MNSAGWKFKMTGLGLCAAGLMTCMGLCAKAADQYWTPRGAPESDAGKMKTIDQVEPRTYISQLPYEITNSGSYYIGCPLYGAPGSNGITIKASHVQLDLGGFALIGGAGTLSGIIVPNTCDNIGIRNGVVANWGNYGMDMTNARDVAFYELKAFNNAYGGIYAGDNAMLERCSAYGNGTNSPSADPPMDDGIRVGSFSTLIDCKSRSNKGTGIHAFQHSRITECTAVESRQAEGIRAEDYSTIKDCTAAANFNGGIVVAARCRVVGNTTGENGLGNPGTNAPGILIKGDNNIIQDNNVLGNNIGVKINIGFSGNLVVRNIAAKNGGGLADFSPPPIGNYVGPVDILSGGALTNMNPWANFKVP